ncbi:unnamed protein product [Rotaria socialis]|uniref:Uncharacterized protein n=1 Tax=Rotaria socialis TaxID=392032 RepID=A0A821R5T9_9BILA|nr:unnamed protein product [Rotaria socialis]CAF4838186.1 unnamed protein product [Rotaria socialis]
MIPSEKLSITNQCSPVVKLQCVELYFNDTQTFLNFSHHYSRIINKLFDENMSTNTSMDNALFIHIAYDSLGVFSLKIIQSLENIPQRKFHDLGLVMRNRINQTTLFIHSDVQNSTFRVIQVYIDCGDQQGWNTYDYVRKISNEKRPDYIKCEISTPASMTTEPWTISTRRSTLSTIDKQATIYISSAIHKNATIISSTSNTGIIVYTTSSTTKGSTSLATLRSVNMSKSSHTAKKYTHSSFTTTKSTTAIASPSTIENVTQTSSTTNKRPIKQPIFNTTENSSINISSTAHKIQSYATSFSTETTTIVSTKATEQIFITTHSVTISTDMYTSSKSIKSTERNGSRLILIFSLSIVVSLLSCLLIALLVYKLCNKEILGEDGDEEDEDEKQRRQLSTPFCVLNSTSNTESAMSSSQWKRRLF